MAVSIPPFHWWRTVFFLIPAIGVYTIVLGLVSIGSSVFGGRGDLGHRCARGWSWLILATTGVDVAVHGAQHLTPGVGYVFTANHQSIYDIPIVFWSLPHQLRIIAKRSLGRFPVLGWHLQRTGHVLVDRSKPGHEVFRSISAVIGRGLSLIVFPEGTRSGDGRLGRFKKAIFVIAIDASIPVVPLSITGSRHVMRRGRLMTCPGHVRLTVHPPIATKGLSRDDAGDLADRVQAIVAAGVEANEHAATRRVAVGA